VTKDRRRGWAAGSERGTSKPGGCSSEGPR
jgi:hypothetical protein